MKKRMLSLLAAAVLVVSMSACGGVKTANDTQEETKTAETTPAPEDQEKSSDKKLKVGYTVQSMENAYFVSIVEGMKAAAKEKGIDLVVADAAEMRQSILARLKILSPRVWTRSSSVR